MINQVLARATSRSPQLKRLLWRGWYQVLAARYQQREWRFMNYGYAVAPGGVSPDLEPHDEPHRYGIQLYHRVASGASLLDKHVLEVGCGRGGGSSYLARYHGPKSVLGVDYSDQAIRFCVKTHAHPNLAFRQGDAESLPCESSSFDAVVNVESSHCYASFPRFVAEVTRVLRPGGYFLWADLCPAAEAADLRPRFESAGLQLMEEEVISAEVLRALDLMSDERTEMIQRLVPRPLARSFRDFAGVPGTRVYQALRSGSVRYMRAVLHKPG
ncbi:MAG: Methyltransferase type 11 [Armatimonadetes bacterium]|jgi:ubiquinone/menaquinone biosynthesis C-methylase UbiE|nr:Methyltransferase type 11 [Armatimonadota bacterium]